MSFAFNKKIFSQFNGFLLWNLFLFDLACVSASLLWGYKCGVVFGNSLKEILKFFFVRICTRFLKVCWLLKYCVLQKPGISVSLVVVAKHFFEFNNHFEPQIEVKFRPNQYIPGLILKMSSDQYCGVKFFFSKNDVNHSNIRFLQNKYNFQFFFHKSTKIPTKTSSSNCHKLSNQCQITTHPKSTFALIFYFFRTSWNKIFFPSLSSSKDFNQKSHKKKKSHSTWIFHMEFYDKIYTNHIKQKMKKFFVVKMKIWLHS